MFLMTVCSLAVKCYDHFIRVYKTALLEYLNLDRLVGSSISHFSYNSIALQVLKTSYQMFPFTLCTFWVDSQDQVYNC